MVARGSAGATAALPALPALPGGLLSRLRRPSPGLNTGGPRLRGVLVQGQRNPGRILEDGKPAHPGNLRLRHYDRPSGGLDLLERAVDILGKDVVDDARRQIFRLLKASARRARGLEHRVIHLRHVLELPIEYVFQKRFRFLGRVRMNFHVHNAVGLLSHVLRPPLGIHGMHARAIKTWASGVGEVRPSRSNPDPAERDDRDDEHRRGLDGQHAEFQGHRRRHGIEQAGTEEVKRKMKNANVDTIWNVSDDFRTTERAMAKAPKNIVPRNNAPAMRTAPSQVGAKLAPNTGKAKPNTRREPATTMMSVAKMMLRMYWARVKGPIRSCSNIPFFRSNQSCVPAFVPPLMTVRVTAPAARKRE